MPAMIVPLSMLMIAVAAACSDQPATAVEQAESNGEFAMPPEKEAPAQPIRPLPDSFGRTFASLDEYLAHLRRYAGPIDKPWYREIRPGVYERVTTIRPSRAPETFTRAELMERYGFTR